MAEPKEIARILVALADDHSSDAALAEGIRLACAHAAELRLIHVVDTAPKRVGLILPDLEAVAQPAREAGEETIDEALIVALRHGVRAEQALLERPVLNPAGEIAGEAARWGADLVIVGRHTRRRLSRLLHPSVSEAVARAARCRVLVVASPTPCSAA